MVEQYLHSILVVSIVIACLTAAAILLYLIIHFKKKSDAKQVLRNGRRSDDFLYNLLATTFPKRYLMKNVLLPQTLSSGTAGTSLSDVIFVCHGGISVIRSFTKGGKIDNPIHGDWLLYQDQQTVRIPNPFEENAACVHSIEQILQREGLSNIPIHNLVVFTKNGVKFRNKMDQLVSPSALLNRLHDDNQNRFLFFTEMRRCIDAIKKYRMRRQVVRSAPPSNLLPPPRQYAAQQQVRRQPTGTMGSGAVRQTRMN